MAVAAVAAAVVAVVAVVAVEVGRCASRIYACGATWHEAGPPLSACLRTDGRPHFRRECWSRRRTRTATCWEGEGRQEGPLRGRGARSGVAGAREARVGAESGRGRHDGGAQRVLTTQDLRPRSTRQKSCILIQVTCDVRVGLRKVVWLTLADEDT